jgi:hypothetical protein
MRRFAVAVCLFVLIAACGGGDPAAGDDTVPTLEEWCAAQAVDRCVDGFYLLYEDPGLEACIVRTTAGDDLYQQCVLEGVPDEPPVTTIPPDDPGIDPGAAARERMRADRVAVSADLVSVLETAHPGGEVEVTLVPVEPLSLRESDALVGGFEGIFERAWRTDHVCLIGEGFPPEGEPSRVAYRDGVARAERLRREVEASPTPVTGYFILSDMWAKLAEGARKLTDPGVMIEALSAEVPVRVLPDLLVHPGLVEVWVGVADEWYLDLSEPSIPECTGE